MWKKQDILQATNGKLKGDFAKANSVVIDSRKIQPDALFIALIGENFDGHDFVKDVLAKGASAAIVQKIPENLPENSPLIIVDDTYQALLALARYSRKNTNARIVAVTGSIGKTSTKEAIKIGLVASGKTYATEGNLNNHIGLPLSLANLPKDTEFGVFELGMNHKGEISFLTNILRPEVAVITNVEAVHLEFFNSVKEIAEAKAEIMEGVTQGGTIILNADNEFYAFLREKAHSHGLNILSFGKNKTADARLISSTVTKNGTYITANSSLRAQRGNLMPVERERLPRLSSESLAMTLNAIGSHFAYSALATILVAQALKLDVEKTTAALKEFSEPAGRGKLINKNSITIIDDCYNASPASMKAAIAKLAAIGENGHKIAILGDMLELGEQSGELHKELLTSLQKHKIDKVYLCGKFMKQLYDILSKNMQAGYAETSAQLAPTLQKEDVVLIKGSHGSKMDIVRDKLINS